MKKLRFLALTGAAYILTMLAFVSAAGACFGWNYQPEMPKSLRK
ncbi:cyclic lactone autoinducer peptide [Desulfitibacter alkalitolerans]|nr:cyclic lactone autoinducer peptide [Desulfitibacter alkalitolerans]